MRPEGEINSWLKVLLSMIDVLFVLKLDFKNIHYILILINQSTAFDHSIGGTDIGMAMYNPLNMIKDCL